MDEATKLNEALYGFPTVIDDRLINENSLLRIKKSPCEGKLVEDIKRLEEKERGKCPYCGSYHTRSLLYHLETKQINFTTDETTEYKHYTCKDCGCEFEAGNHFSYNRSFVFDLSIVTLIAVSIYSLLVFIKLM